MIKCMISSLAFGCGTASCHSKQKKLLLQLEAQIERQKNWAKRHMVLCNPTQIKPEEWRQKRERENALLEALDKLLKASISKILTFQVESSLEMRPAFRKACSPYL